MGKGKVFAFWLYSYLAVLFIPIVIAAMVLWHSQSLLLHEVRRSNDTLLAQVRQSVDSQAADIRRLGRQLSIDPELNAYLSRDTLETPEAKLDAISLIKSFSAYTSSNGTISGFYVYLQANRHVLTASTYYSPEDAYREFHGKSGFHAEDWSALMDTFSIGRFLNLDPDREKAGNDLAYVQSLPIQYNREARATLVVLLNQERIKTALESVGLASESEVYIVDGEGQPVLATGPLSRLDDLAVRDFKQGSGFRVQETNGEKAAVSYLKSEATGWSYVSVVPSRVYSAQIDMLQQIIYAALVLCITAGGGLAYWMTRRNYAPLRGMMAMMASLGEPGPAGREDEFQRLRMFISRNVHALNENRSKMHAQHRQLRSHFLARLLKGRVDSSSALTQMLEMYNFDFRHERFAVILAQVEDDDALQEVRREFTMDSDRELGYFVVSNIMEEELARRFPACACEVDGLIACLVNLPDGEEEEGWLRLAAEQVHSFLGSRFGILLSIGISGAGQSRTDIPCCYEQALEALEYKLVLGMNQVLAYRELAQPREEIYYPLDTERQLVNYMMAGNYEEASEVLREIVRTNFEGSALSLQMSRLLMYELVGTMLKAIDQIGVDAAGIIDEKPEFVKRMTAHQSIAGMESAILQFLRQVCGFMAGRKRSRNSDLKERVLAYVGKNLPDSSLSLTGVADEFDLNPTYLSRFFKEQTGENLIDYVNKCRVELAKELLKASSGSLADIGLRTGFASSQSLIRVFKKYEGITPGQYRQSRTG